MALAHAPKGRPSTPPRNTPRAQAAFREYCKLGPTRSLRRLARHLAVDKIRQDAKLGRSAGKEGESAWERAVEARTGALLNVVYGWSSTYEWQRRVAEWDEEQAEKTATAAREAALRVLSAQGENAEAWREAAHKQVLGIITADDVARREYELAAQEWFKAYQAGTLPPGAEPPKPPRPVFGAEALVKLLGVAVPTERAARGLPPAGSLEDRHIDVRVEATARAQSGAIAGAATPGNVGRVGPGAVTVDALRMLERETPGALDAWRGARGLPAAGVTIDALPPIPRPQAAEDV